ncbi:MAG: choice-of-anchor J domain-containing protein [Thermodesulfobacteriota bacterium]
MTGRKRGIWGILIAVFILIHTAGVHAEETVVYAEGFETGFNGWGADNGVWDVCLRSQQEPWGGGQFYVATVCDGYYPGYTDSRLISPSMTLPAITGDEELHLRFWQWFSYSTYDTGFIQVSVWDDTAGSWSGWVTVGNSIANTTPVWSLMDVDLSAYAGQKIRVGFYHTAARDVYGNASESYGWYIDDVEFISKVPEFDGGFESGWEEWSADRGLWEVGIPTAGPAAAHNGTQCVGTVLGGTYPGYTDSRLISPSITLPAIAGDEEVHLRFWQWFSYSTYDTSYIQVQVWDETVGSWSAWASVGNSIADTSRVWSLMDVDLSAYAGQKIRVGFYHTAARDVYGNASESYGWYIDNVEWFKKSPELTWDFECGWDDWSSDRGLWEVGTPTYGPSACYSGSQCAGTVLDGNYAGYTDSRLISPSIRLPMVGAGEELYLSFRHWFSYSTYDAGQVQISVWDDVAETWSNWVSVGNSIVNTSPAWSLMNVDLTVYTGLKIRIAFYHTAGRDVYGNSSESAGWYIDHIRITGLSHFCECDLNQDTLCDMPDWLVFGSDWGRTDCNEDGVPPCECDLNHDGSCNMLDWLRFGENWGQDDCLICEE